MWLTPICRLFLRVLQTDGLVLGVEVNREVTSFAANARVLRAAERNPVQSTWWDAIKHVLLNRLDLTSGHVPASSWPKQCPRAKPMRRDWRDAHSRSTRTQRGRTWRRSRVQSPLLRSWTSTQWRRDQKSRLECTLIVETRLKIGPR